MGGKFVQHGKLNIKVLRFKDGRSSLELFQRNIRDITEVTGLNQLQDLEELDLSKNKISEITGLENLTNLKKLDLSENQIINIKGLENLTNLLQLDLSKNQIKNVKGLENLANLRDLNISYNEISDSLTFKKLKEDHLNLTNISLEGNPCFNQLMRFKTEILKQNPSKAPILTYLNNLRLIKEGIEYDPKEEWRYLRDNEFRDIVVECLKSNPVFFMNSLYTDLRRILKRQYGEKGLMVIEKYLLENFCLYDGEQILYEFEGGIEQIDDILNNIRASVRGGTIFVTNYRIIAQGTLKVSGHSTNAWIWGGSLVWALSGSSKRTETKEGFIENSVGQELPCYGYQFKRENPLGIGKTRKAVRYSVNNDDPQIKSGDSTSKQRKALINAVRIIIITPPKELIDELYENLRGESKSLKQIVDKFQRLIDMGVNEKIKRQSFLAGIRGILKDKEGLSDSEKVEIVIAVYELDKLFFMNSIYPKMKRWNFPAFLRVKEGFFENLREGLNNEQIIDAFQRVIDMGVDNNVKSKSFLKSIEGILQDKEGPTDSEKVEIIIAVYKLDTELFMSLIYPKMKRWKFPAFLRVKEDLFEKLPLPKEQKYDLG